MVSLQSFVDMCRGVKNVSHLTPMFPDVRLNKVTFCLLFSALTLNINVLFVVHFVAFCVRVW